MTLEQLLADANGTLKNTDDAKTSIKEIFGHVFKKDLLFAKFDIGQSLDADKTAEFNELIKRRADGEPLQYIIGHWEFAGHDFIVRKGVLIPRDDTYTLYEKALPFLDKNKLLIDLCTGSGILGISLSLDTNCTAICTDISEHALALAEENRKRLDAKSVTVVKKDIFRASDLPKADVIVCNPPYIRKKDMESLQTEVLHEPKEALCGGADGLDFYRAIVKYQLSALKDGGFVAVETGFDQTVEVAEILKNAGLSEVMEHKDLNGMYRVVTGIKQTK